MKKTLLILSSVIMGMSIHAQSVFINEIHYDNLNTDTGEGVEIAGPAGTDLSTYSLVFYNGNGGLTYATLPLTGTIPDQSGCGYGVVFFAQLGVQNGAPDGIALVDGPSTVVQFLSYEGTLTATDGPAIGMLSTDIGVAQDGSQMGMSLQLTGSGTQYTDFTWAPDAAQTFNALNNAQDFCVAPSPTISFASAGSNNAENSGTVTITLNINPTAATDQTVEITVNDVTATYGNDYSTSPVGTAPFVLNILAGASSISFDVTITDDATQESDEDVEFTITAVSAGLQTGGISTHTMTIIDNDMATTPIPAIQATTGGDLSDMETDVVTTGGRVSGISSSGFYIQDGDGAWHGIYVYDTGVNSVNLGDSVIVTGTVAEFAPGASVEKVTQITNVTLFTNVGNFFPYAPTVLSTANVNDEMYESVLVSVLSASTTTALNGFGEYIVNDGSGDVMIDDFLYLTTPAPLVGNVYNITGLPGHNFGNYKIMPRNVNDVELISGASINELSNTLTGVYPNPSNGSVNFVNPTKAKVYIYNTLGELVLTTTQPKVTLRQGVYLVKIGESTTRLVVM